MCVQSKLSDTFSTTMKTALANGPMMQAYDVYLERGSARAPAASGRRLRSASKSSRTWNHYDFVGGMVLSKFKTRENNIFRTLLYIDSFAAIVGGSGYGLAMFTICSRLALAQCTPTMDATIAAQCVDEHFWKHRMFETSEARAAIFQVNAINPQLYKIYDAVKARAKRIKDPNNLLDSPTSPRQVMDDDTTSDKSDDS